MVRIFLNDQGQLDPDDLHHLVHVLRLRAGDDLVAVRDGQAYEAKLSSNFPESPEVLLGDKRLEEEKSFYLYLLQGLGKGQKFEEILEHGTEVGVDSFFPIQMTRSIRKVQGKEEKLKTRWEKILKKAAKQSRRLKIPEVSLVKGLEEALESLPEDCRILCCYEEEKTRRLDQVLTGKEKNLALVIGPEGGLDPEEVALIQARGGQCISLGPRILRTETAALIASDRVHVLMEGGGHGREK